MLIAFLTSIKQSTDPSSNMTTSSVRSAPKDHLLLPEATDSQGYFSIPATSHVLTDREPSPLDDSEQWFIRYLRTATFVIIPFFAGYYFRSINRN